MFEVTEQREVSQASFAFGDIPLRFESADRAWLSYLDRRYRSFSVAPSSDSFVVRFETTSAPLPPALVTPLAAHLEAVHCEPTSVGYRVSTETSRCEIDLGARRAILRGPSAMYPLDNVLRHLLPLLWEDGLIVHSALVADGDGRGVLACGPSGSGKSTIARLSNGRALADELAAVRIESQGVTAVGLPFWESRPGSARLRAVLHLRHGATHHLERLRSEEAMRRLASQVLWPVWDRAAMARSFDYFIEMARSVPAFDLSFAPTADVWDSIDKEVS
jgi:hypothetical protein